MRREANIPLFLWIATALLAHLLSGGGADQVSRTVEGVREIGEFAKHVQLRVRGLATPTEVTLLDDEQPPEEEKLDDELPPDPTESEKDPQDADPLKPKPDQSERETKPDPKKDPKKPEPEKAEKQQPEPEKKPELKKPEPKKPEDKKKLEVEAEPLALKADAFKKAPVEQAVQNKNQPDNPNAEFLGNEANRVAEQTRARITSTLKNEAQPTPGANARGPAEDPGNGELSQRAQDRDEAGEKNRAPNEPAKEAAKAVAASAAQAAAPGTQATQPAAANQQKAERPQTEQKAVQKTVAQSEMPNLLDSNASSSFVAGPRQAIVEQEAQKARKRLPPRPISRNPADLLGLGASGVTPNGISLNLSPENAESAITREQLATERRADAERRRSLHRGSWNAHGLERWRASIENYVAHVKLGNQTALNTARVPFASYLVGIHNRLHPLFAETFLNSLDRLPDSHPMNRRGMYSVLELVLDPSEGRIAKMGVARTSGVTAFDIAALEAADHAQPFGPAPREIVSPDGKVYLHWEFHRNPDEACHPLNARPAILKLKQEAAPPQPEPAPPAKPEGSKPAPSAAPSASASKPPAPEPAKPAEPAPSEDKAAEDKNKQAPAQADPQAGAKKAPEAKPEDEAAKTKSGQKPAKKPAPKK